MAVVKIAVPELELELVAEKLTIPVAFRVAEAETVNTSNVFKSWTSSVPLTMLKVSFPPPPMILSSPAPPVMISTLEVPVIVKPSV